MKSRLTRRKFFAKTGTLGAAAGYLSGGPASGASAPNLLASGQRSTTGTSKSGRRPADYGVILQDIGDPLTRMSWPPTPEKLVEASIGLLRGTAISCYSYGINHAGGVTHCSKAYPVVGDEQKVLRSASSLRMNEAVQRLCAAGHDPLEVMCKGAHEAGVDIFLRLRMNDHHDRWGHPKNLERPSQIPKTTHIEPYFYTPRWKYDHPEWLIGDPEAPHPERSFHYMEANSGNYAIGPFRQLMYGMAEEALTRYDLDGFELDFFRSPFLFAHWEAYSQRHVITEFVRRIRKLSQQRAAQRGRPIFLSARVPASVDLSLRIGIDLPTWLQEGLLDLVVISNGLLVFSPPWDEIADLGKKVGIPSVACFTSARPTRQGLESLRAATYRALSKGLTGIQLWNYFYNTPVYHRPGEKFLGLEFTHEMVDREKLRTGSKAYFLDHTVQTGGLEGTFGHAEWPGQVPLMIGASTDGIGHTVSFDVADDVSAGDRKAPPRLWLRLIDVAPEDQLDFWWNGQSISPDPEAYPGTRVRDSSEYEFQLAPEQVRLGENQIVVRLRNRSPRLEPYVTLVDGRLSIPEMV